MKISSKLPLAALIASLIATAGAFADDPQLQNRLAMQRAQNQAGVLQQTTVAVYSGQRASRNSVVSTVEERPEVRFELRTNAHGQQFGVYTTAQ